MIRYLGSSEVHLPPLAVGGVHVIPRLKTLCRFDVDGDEVLLCPPVASLFANQKQIAIFLSAQSADFDFWLLDHWEPEGLNFDFAPVLKQWHKQWGLRVISLSQIQGISDSQKNSRHPLRRILEEDKSLSCLGFNIRFVYAEYYQGLLMLHRLKQANKLIDAHYLGKAKLNERLNRFVNSEKPVDDALIESYLQSLGAAILKNGNSGAFSASRVLWVN